MDLLNFVMFGSLAELILQLSIVAALAALIGYATARRVYKSEGAARLSLLHQEITRLRRRVAEADTRNAATRRNNERVRRRLRDFTDMDGKLAA